MANIHRYNIDQSPSLVLNKALINVQINLKLTQKELSAIIHASPATICRYVKGQAINPESAEGQFAMCLIRIYRSLNALFGGNDVHARAWLMHYNSDFVGKPIELMKSMSGLYAVLTYLDAMRALA